MSVEEQFEDDERALLTRIHELLDVRMKDKRKRYVHSLGVAETALHLAEVYGVDRFDAAAAGLIHDWDKVLSDDELVTRALHYGIKIAGSPSAATPLLHGPAIMPTRCARWWGSPHSMSCSSPVLRRVWSM